MNSTRMSSILIVLLAFLLPGCEGEVEPIPVPGEDGTIFDVQDVGARGLTFHGQSTLLENQMVFPETVVQLSGTSLALDSGPRSLAQFHNPPLEYRGDVPMMTIRFMGLAVSAVPGEMTLDLVEFSADMLDSDARPVDPVSAVELRAALEENGIVLPEIRPDDSNEIRVQINVSDQHYRSIEITSDAGFFNSFYGQRPDIDPEPVAPLRR
ncbi:MAG: hypothetical protein ACNA7J_00170 [Wenzhouxiangella sp.]